MGRTYFRQPTLIWRSGRVYVILSSFCKPNYLRKRQMEEIEGS